MTSLYTCYQPEALVLPEAGLVYLWPLLSLSYMSLYVDQAGLTEIRLHLPS